MVEKISPQARMELCRLDQGSLISHIHTICTIGYQKKKNSKKQNGKKKELQLL